eukprot:TRINITY_DN13841_c0_g1_i19.p1 TRINITY_DN13841_c0_g1~~TRINITY_DN13841_c0_g1_i19.p1  ORF type:complete len:423 (+),score=111.90 TRINITY_DN13841_c0_g1_i19:74-1342(+)
MCIRDSSKEEVLDTINKVKFQTPQNERKESKECEESVMERLEESLRKDIERPKEDSGSRSKWESGSVNCTPSKGITKLKKALSNYSSPKARADAFKSPQHLSTARKNQQLLDSYKGVAKKRANDGQKNADSALAKTNAQSAQDNSQSIIYSTERSHEKTKLPPKYPQTRTTKSKNNNYSFKGSARQKPVHSASASKINSNLSSPSAQKRLLIPPHIKLAKSRTRKNISAIVSADEASFISQAADTQKPSLFSKRWGCETTGASSRKMSVCEGQGNSYYKEVMDKNFRKQQMESQFSHHPEILSVSKQKRPQSFDEMCYEPVKKKQEKLKALRKEMMEKSNKEHTFTPELIVDAYGHVDSKLKLKDGVNTYLERVKKLRQEKERKQELSKQMREIEELAECTHAPKINRGMHSARYSRTTNWN